MVLVVVVVCGPSDSILLPVQSLDLNWFWYPCKYLIQINWIISKIRYKQDEVTFCYKDLYSKLELVHLLNAYHQIMWMIAQCTVGGVGGVMVLKWPLSWHNLLLIRSKVFLIKLILTWLPHMRLSNGEKCNKLFLDIVALQKLKITTDIHA